MPGKEKTEGFVAPGRRVSIEPVAGIGGVMGEGNSTRERMATGRSIEFLVDVVVGVDAGLQRIMRRLGSYRMERQGRGKKTHEQLRTCRHSLSNEMGEFQGSQPIPAGQINAFPPGAIPE